MKPRRFAVVTQKSRNGFSGWISPRMDKYLMQCCDCGLVHEMQFRIAMSPVVKSARSHQKVAVEFRARRAIGHTEAQRKARKIQVK